MTEDMIPIVMFLVIGAALISRSYFGYRSRQEQQQTVRELISRGQDVSPELLETLMEGLMPSPQADLRRGVISIMLGIAVIVFGVVLGEEDAQRPLMGLSAFPFLVGIAYVILWWMKQRNSQG